jgi:hypothetical protein
VGSTYGMLCIKFPQSRMKGERHRPLVFYCYNYYCYLLKEAFHSSKILDKEGLYCWFTCANNIVSEIGFDIESTEKCQTIKEVKQYKHIIKDSANDNNKNLILNKIKNLNGNNKTYLYKFLKQNKN